MTAFREALHLPAPWEDAWVDDSPQPPTVDTARRAAKAFVKTCRRLGDDVQHHVGLETVAAGLGFRGWHALIRDLGIAPDRPWSDALGRDRALALLPGVEDDVLDAAIAVVRKRLGAHA